MSLFRQIPTDRIISLLPAPMTSYIEANIDNAQKAISHVLFLMVPCNLAFLISSFVAFYLPNMGFNSLLVSILSCLQNGLLWMVFNHPNSSSFPQLSTSPFNVGMILGGTIGMSILLFVISHYYGQLSYCNAFQEELEELEIRQFECKHKGAMWCIWFFGGLLLWLNVILGILLVGGKDEIVTETVQYQDIGVTVEDYNNPQSHQHSLGQQPQQQQQQQQQGFTPPSLGSNFGAGDFPSVGPQDSLISDGQTSSIPKNQQYLQV